MSFSAEREVLRAEFFRLMRNAQQQRRGLWGEC